MTKIINILTSATAIAMTVLPLSALGTAAHAEETRIQIADLDLARPTDAMRFQRRLDVAAERICNVARSPLGDQAACRIAVRQEAVEKLGGVQRHSLQLAMSRTALTDRATAGF
jgi:UrcA family protein